MTKGEAYKTFTTKLYNYSDPRLGGDKVVYGSPYKQWVYDKSITGATIPTGFTINGSIVPTGTSGMKIDFDNGRIIFNSGVSTNLNITGTYSVKEVNSYVTDQPEDNLIIENKYVTNSRFTVTEDYIPAYNPVTPCIFASIETAHNTAFAFGGEDETKCIVKLVAFCENLYQLDGLLSIFGDSYNEFFSLIPMTGHPLGEFNEMKTGVYPTGYDYNNLSNAYNSQKMFISHVETSKIRDNVLKELNPILHIGFLDFEITTYRYPRL
ncbi:hypothetical protein EB169_00295 [archaeon]|nr:hypothetical protein [archaeon]NDB54254.1 hypothetical protein [archaeon]